MRKILLLLSTVCMGLNAFSQDSITNGSFERWTSGTYDYPQNYPYTSNVQNFTRYHLPFNVTKTTDAYHGTYAIQLTSNASSTDTAFGYFLSVNPNNGNGPMSWTGGMAYNQKPTGIRGYYQYNVASGDSGTIIIAFSKAGVNIGTYMFTLGGDHSGYTLFDFQFNPALTHAPDSVAIGAISCRLINGQPAGKDGSILKLDSISFTGVTSQPDMLNGDFETWDSKTITSLNDWYSDNGDQQEGVYQTSDAVHGGYAVELKTYSRNRDNRILAQAGQVSNGYYPKNCNGDCKQLGGSPFTNQVDTLAFYYKYVPAGNDSATVSLSLVKNGSNIMQTGTFLKATDVYKYKEIPFNAGSAPDTMILTVQSSSWNDTLLTFVGSDLKIDRMFFKSQSIAKTTPVITWDNPADINVGALLGTDQLNATANVVGSFVYDPAAGTELNAGNGQTLHAYFTPIDTIDYEKVSKSVVINVIGPNGLPSISATVLKTYPNPANNNFTIESPENIASVVIANIQGNIVREEHPVTGKTAFISIQDLEPGVYLVTVRTANLSVVKRLIVE